jgi:hypothetical protein
MTLPLDTKLPVFDQFGRPADILSISLVPVEFPITAMVRSRDGGRTPVGFDRFGNSRRGPSIFISNQKDNRHADL